MLKDIVIAALGAGLMVQYPWIAQTAAAVRITAWIGIFTCLLFFCLFCDLQQEKWRKNGERAENLRALVERLRNGKGGWDGNPKR